VTVKNTSGSAQTIMIFVGSSTLEDSRITGTVSVTNQISAGSTQIDISDGTLLPINFFATPLVPIASNPRGILVRRTQVYASAAASSTVSIRMVAAPAIPITMTVANGFQMAAGASSTSVNDMHSDQNYALPASWGVWVVTSHTGSPSIGAGASIAYDPQ
jgi:hypothetical protein